MEDFIIKLRISAECKSDAEELLNDYTGKETALQILNVCSKSEQDRIDKIRNFK